MSLSEHNGRPYYRKSVRRAGKVTSEYCGSGAAALLMARLDRGERERREAAVAEWRAERTGLEDEDREHAELFRLVETVTRAALEAAGFHRHDRGGWRRRRMGDQVQENEVHIEATSDFGEDGYEKLKRLNDGDTSLVPWLRGLLARDASGELAERCGGDPSRFALEKVLDRIAGGDNPIMREAIQRKVECVRDDLAGPHPTALERILAGRAAFCWLVVHWFETSYARQTTDLTLAQANFHQHRIDRAHRRFLSACVALAKVRRLALPGPAVQVNLNQAINVAAAASAGLEGN